MDKEMDDVSLVRMVFNACGKKEDEVKNAAIKPVTEIQFIFFELNKGNLSYSPHINDKLNAGFFLIVHLMITIQTPINTLSRSS
jgi:hypothetical protein